MKIIKNGRRIKGFVYKDKTGQYWYAFGKPSQNNYIAFACKDESTGIANIKMPTYNR